MAITFLQFQPVFLKLYFLHKPARCVRMASPDSVRYDICCCSDHWAPSDADESWPRVT